MKLDVAALQIIYKKRVKYMKLLIVELVTKKGNVKI
jgi:hypothetical protein